MKTSVNEDAVICVELLQVISTRKDFIFLRSHFPRTQICVTPNDPVDENQNRSTVINVKALLQICVLGKK